MLLPIRRRWANVVYSNKELAELDPTEAFVGSRVCDPAMGSGHVLVSLVDYLADAVLTEITDAPAAADWGEYRSPLARRIAVHKDRVTWWCREVWRATPDDDEHYVYAITL
jgi:hypothetical protein